MTFFIKNLSSLTAIAALCLSPSIALAVGDAKDLSAAISDHGEEQYNAIDHLGAKHQDGSIAIPKLQQLLKNEDPHVRWRSARALGDYGEQAKDTAADLVALLKDKDPVVQYHAAIALGKVDDKSDATVNALVAAVTSKDGRVARAAVAALRNLKPGPERVTAALKQALTSNDQSVTLYALEALVEEKGKATPLLKEALKHKETAYLASTAIEQIGSDACDTVPELTELLSHTKHSQLLIQTLLALASIGPKAQSAESAIVPLLDDPTDVTVPVAAAYALGAIGAKNSDEQLKKLAESDKPFQHTVATWALAKLHPDDKEQLKKAIDELTKGLASNDAQMRTVCAKGLQMLQPPPEMVAPALMAVAADPDPNVSANIVSALAGLGESIVPRASKALESPKARDLAIRVLTKLGPKATGAVDALIEADKESDPAFKQKVNFALAAIGPAASAATPILVEGIFSDDKGVRESALYALREIGPSAKAATRPLLRKATSERSFDSLAAAWALSRIASDNSAIGGKIMPVLIRGLSHADEQTRLNSAEAIAEWGPAGAPAAAELKKVAHDDGSSAVRAAAEAALARINGRQ
jgi:HEAT repeat protein